MYAKYKLLTKAEVQIQIIFQLLNLNSYTRLNPKHKLKHILKSYPTYHRYYSTSQSPRVPGA
jgi:hypothetical protein